MSTPSLASATLMGLLLLGPLAAHTTQGPKKQKASFQPTPIWASSEKEGIRTPQDLAFVHALDRAWSTGKAEPVLALFDLLHPQVGRDLQARVLGTTGGRTCIRKSRILAITTAGSWRALFLSSEIRRPIQNPVPGGETSKVQARLFEIAVIPGMGSSGKTADSQTLHSQSSHSTVPQVPKIPKVRLLLETLPESQAHVMSPEVKGTNATIGSPITPGARYRCLPCNFEIGIPDTSAKDSALQGGWFLIGRPPFLSGTFEQVEIYHLESDFSVELVVQPDPSKGPEYMKECLISACCGIAACHGMDPGWVKAHHEEPKILTLDHRKVLVTSFEVQKSGSLPGRSFLFFGYQHLPVDYFISFQGPSGSLKPDDPRVVSIFKTFRILRPNRPGADTKRLAMAAHGGGGVFVGNDFSHPALGLLQPGVPGWKTFRKLGITKFHIGWTNPKTGSCLMLAALERPQASWTNNAIRCWFDAWLRSQGKGFSKRSKPTKIRIGNHPGLRVDFERHTPKGERIRGFQILLYQGKLLYLLRGEAMPSQDQDEAFALLEDRALALQLR